MDDHASSIKYLPYIKVLDLMSLDVPIKVTTSRRGTIDGPLWWKFAPSIPVMRLDPRSAVSMVNGVFCDRFNAYLFSQAFFTFYMYNNLYMGNPLKYYIDDTSYSFYYFIGEGEMLTVPLLVKHPLLNVILTQFDDGKPVLKIAINNQTTNVNSTHIERNTP
jgi:hypothetical protein